MNGIDCSLHYALTQINYVVGQSNRGHIIVWILTQFDKYCIPLGCVELVIFSISFSTVTCNLRFLTLQYRYTVCPAEATIIVFIVFTTATRAYNFCNSCSRLATASKIWFPWLLVIKIDIILPVWLKINIIFNSSELKIISSVNLKTWLKVFIILFKSYL